MNAYASTAEVLLRVRTGECDIGFTPFFMTADRDSCPPSPTSKCKAVPAAWTNQSTGHLYASRAVQFYLSLIRGGGSIRCRPLICTYARPMGVQRTCGEPDEIKKSTHPKHVCRSSPCSGSAWRTCTRRRRRPLRTLASTWTSLHTSAASTSRRPLLTGTSPSCEHGPAGSPSHVCARPACTHLPSHARARRQPARTAQQRAGPVRRQGSIHAICFRVPPFHTAL